MATTEATTATGREGKLKLGLISTHCDWCHSDLIPWGREGVQHIVDRYVEAGIPRLCWRCTDGGTAHYWSKLREPFHGLDADNCHATYFMTPDLGRYWRTDYRTFDSFAAAVELGHEAGLEVYAWCQVDGEDDGFGYKSRRVKKHPELCTVGRDGQRFTGKLGWAYPDNREYVIGLLQEVLAYQPNGVILDFVKNRGDYRDRLNDDDGVVYYGYEPPAVQDFKAKTGRDPFQIPNSDPEWLQHRADYMSQFVREARQMQRGVAPETRWIGQVWGGGSTLQFQLLSKEEYKRGGPYYTHESHPVRDLLGGMLEDVAAWMADDAFDVIYPLTAGDTGLLRANMATVKGLSTGRETQVQAGAYVWNIDAEGLGALCQAAMSSGAEEIYLVESQAFEPQLWPAVGQIVREFAG